MPIARKQLHYSSAVLGGFHFAASAAKTKPIVCAAEPLIGHHVAAADRVKRGWLWWPERNGYFLVDSPLASARGRAIAFHACGRL